MPSKTRSAHARRYLSIVLLALLLIVPSTILITGSSGSDGETDAKGTRAWLDIAIDGIEIVRTSQSNNVYPGQTVEIWVKLIHDDRPFPSDTKIDNRLGNDFTTILVVDDGFTNVTTQYQSVGVSRKMTINYTGEDPVGGGANPPFVVKFFYQVPDKAPNGLAWTAVNFQMTATITVDDDDKSDNSKSGSGLRVSEPEFSPLIYEPGYEDSQGPIHPADVGDPLNIKFMLKNDGPAVDDIGIDILSAPPGWRVGGFEPITVYPNDEQELDLFIQIPNNPFLAQADGIYTIVTRAYSKFYAGPYPKDPSYTFRIKIGFQPGVKIVPRMEAGSNYLEPGEEHRVYFEVTNTGNGKDSYTMSAFLDEVHTKKGWKVYTPAPTLTKELTPSDSTDILIRIFIPEDAAKFYNVNIYLTGKSSQVPTFEREGEPMLIFASTRYAADIETPPSAGFWVEPGRENIIKFNFTNMGNDKDIEQYLNVSRRPLGWLVFIDQSPLRAQRGIGPRTTVTLEMTVFVPETAYTTDRVSRPRVVVKAYGGPFSFELDSETFEFNIPTRYKVDLSSPEPEKEGFIGGQVNFLVNVRNAGNWEDTFNLSVESDDLKVELDRESVFVFPDDSYLVEVKVKIPQDAAADTNPDTPYPNDPQRNWYDGYNLRVYAYSTSSEDPEDTLRELKLTLHVQPFYDFTMEVDPEEKPLLFSTDHDQNRAVKIRITNIGNIADLIRLDWEDNPYSWLRLQNTYIDLPYGQFTYAVVNINPLKGDVETPETINVTLQGFSRNNPEQELTRALKITITFYKMKFDPYEARMNNEVMEAQAFGDVGFTYSFQVIIRNTGSTEFHPTYYDTLYVVMKDGPFEVDRANITWLEIGAEKEVQFKHTFVVPGPHVIRFELESETPISEESEVVIQKTLIIKPPPEIKDPEDPTVPMWAILIPVLLLLLFITLIVIFVVKYNQIYISPIDTGYDEDGEYKPWAVKEKLKEEEKKEIAPPPEKEALPAPSKPQLPPGPPQPQGGRPPQPSQGRPPAPQQMRQGPVPGAPQQVGRPMPGRPMPQQPGARPPMPQPGARPPMPPPQGARPPVPPGARPPNQPPRPGQ